MTLRSILEPLLAGEFICQISNSRIYQQLQNEDTRIKVNALLEELGKQLCNTDNNEAYFCSYSDLSSAKDGRIVQNQFERMRDQIAPVIYFLTLQMRVEDRDVILISGDTLRFHDLLSCIEKEPAYLSDLKHIGRYELFKKVRNKQTTQDRLLATLEVLEKEGYITLTNSESSIYQVTGKIEYFYSCLEFIQDHEQIPLQEETEGQGDLNLDS